MQALASLVGVLVGGLLVMVTDVLRRRSEWRRQQLQRLLDNGVELLTVHHRLVGELVEAYELGISVDRVHGGSAERYRVGTQFSATPGSEFLLDEVEELRKLHRALRDSFSKPHEWDSARAEYVRALRDIEAKLRTIGSSGNISRRSRGSRNFVPLKKSVEEVNT
ncbi:hypothetical protein AB0J90_26240 [Micromonospora sp. NPDC049523]|uniref:hypothetical protein n=1 Tax=Micromonospora sp. NPDC049523 TaxID=3155921 RepID=UPI003440104E